uniref:Uncharacterized protein n=1 Tax=Oryza sativa subsp. japonica TaxID=39947 RepID=Q6H425_ORYSJ|nr:hypothetical protein [Oryza sativa Japonica Group]BAD26524.1 hypothetical protein [Oryza sativa Japonica Group]BAD26526.1 hypothetical protein [Oryza sativa Japonica Group]BAD29639.1 hypothetical protein [Oryza sativa Japonica Group]BAD29641.1 hypothetical protein [Oryza sativa Japonica Group]
MDERRAALEDSVHERKAARERPPNQRRCGLVAEEMTLMRRRSRLIVKPWPREGNDASFSSDAAALVPDPICWCSGPPSLVLAPSPTV